MKRRAFLSNTYFLVKITRGLLTALVILILSFFLVRLSGNPALILLGEEATPEAVAQITRKWGLDQPAHVQFLKYMGGVLRGDLGTSLIKDRPVMEIIGERVGATLSLMIPATFLSISLGIVLGTLAAVSHKKRTDRLILFLSTFGFSLPNFFFGVILIFFFSVILGVLPSGGNDSFRNYIMPLIAIVTADVAVFTRFTRAALVDIFEKHYIVSFRSLGFREMRILLKQALPNAGIALGTISGFYIGALIGGAIVTETIFSWPGLGTLLVSSIRSRDFPLVQALVLIFGLSIVVANLAVDLLYGLLDPRVRKGATR